MYIYIYTWYTISTSTHTHICIYIYIYIYIDIWIPNSIYLCVCTYKTYMCASVCLFSRKNGEGLDSFFFSDFFLWIPSEIAWKCGRFQVRCLFLGANYDKFGQADAWKRNFPCRWVVQKPSDEENIPGWNQAL